MVDDIPVFILIIAKIYDNESRILKLFASLI